MEGGEKKSGRGGLHQRDRYSLVCTGHLLHDKLSRATFTSPSFSYSRRRRPRLFGGTGPSPCQPPPPSIYMWIFIYTSDPFANKISSVLLLLRIFHSIATTPLVSLHIVFLLDESSSSSSDDIHLSSFSIPGAKYSLTPCLRLHQLADRPKVSDGYDCLQPSKVHKMNSNGAARDGRNSNASIVDKIVRVRRHTLVDRLLFWKVGDGIRNWGRGKEKGHFLSSSTKEKQRAT